MLRSMLMFIISCFPTDRNGADFTTHQDTPVAAYRQDTYVVFNVDVHIQKTLDSLPPGIFLNNLNLFITLSLGSISYDVLAIQRKKS